MESIKLNQWSKSLSGLCFKPYKLVAEPGDHYIHYIGDAVDTYYNLSGQPVLKYHPNQRWSASGLITNEVITCGAEINRLEALLTIMKL